jgi:hypothetical protein
VAIRFLRSGGRSRPRKPAPRQARRDLASYSAHVPRHRPAGRWLLLYFAAHGARPHRAATALAHRQESPRTRASASPRDRATPAAKSRGRGRPPGRARRTCAEGVALARGPASGLNERPHRAREPPYRSTPPTQARTAASPADGDLGSPAVRGRRSSCLHSATCGHSRPRTPGHTDRMPDPWVLLEG